MSDTSEKVRALFLSLIMVTSVLGVAVAFSGSAVADPPGNSASPVGNDAFVGDETVNTNTTKGLTVQIANLNFSSEPGNVTNVTVNPGFGTSQNNVSGEPQKINHVDVQLYDTNGDLLVENRTVPYDGGNQVVNFSGTAAETGDQVARVVVTAEVSDEVFGDEEIDAGVEVFAPNGNSFGGTSPYDTANTQSVQLADDGDAPASISAFVNSDSQGEVENAEVVFVNADTGNVVNPDNPFLTNSQGNTLPLDVAFGEYFARATKGGFTSERSSTTTLDAGQRNDQVNVKLEATAVPKEVILRPVNPPGEAPADGQTEIVYEAIVIGDEGDQTNVELQGIDVDLTVDTPETVEGAALGDSFSTLGTVTNTTQDGPNNRTLFTVRSDVVHTAQLNATVDNSTGDPPVVFDTAPARFGVLRGEGEVPGQVFDSGSTSGLEDATVWTVTSERYRQNTVHWGTDDIDSVFVDDATNDRFYVRVWKDTDGDGSVDTIIDNDEYEVEVGPSTNPGPGGPQLRLAQNIFDDPTLAELLANSAEIDEDYRNDFLDDWNDETWVGLVDRLNTTDKTVGQGFFVEDRNDDDSVGFLITPLEPGNYTVQVSNNQTNASRKATRPATTQDSFWAIQNTVTVSENVTSDRAQEDTNETTGPILIDETDDDGDYLLNQLYTNGQVGVYYTLIAEKSGYDRDFSDVLVQEDGGSYEDSDDEVLVLSPRDVTPVVNITNIALLPSAGDAPSDAANVSSYDEYAYNNQTDAFSQGVPRNGQAVDVVLVETTGERSGDPINDTVTLSVPDAGGTTDAADWDGEWIAVAGGDTVDSDPANNTITIATGDDGQAIVWLQSDEALVDLIDIPEFDNPDGLGCGPSENTDFGVEGFSGVIAQSQTDTGATDSSCKAFTGITQFGSLSGIVTDGADDSNPIANATVWVEDFQLTQTSVQVRITRINDTHANVGVYEDESSSLQVINASPLFPDSANLVESANVSFVDLRDYRFEDFSSTTRNTFGLVPPTAAGGDSFTLSAVTADTEPQLGEYTLPRVPAKAIDNQYAVKAESPIEQFEGLGEGATRAGVTDDVNVVIPAATGTDFQVSNLNPTDVSVAQGTTITVSADITNTGTVADEATAEFRVDGGTLATNTTEVLSAGETDTVTFTVSTAALAPGNYTHGVFTVDDSQTANLTVTNASAGVDVNGDGNVSTDVDGDGLHEDVNGDGVFNIVDIQVMFANLSDVEDRDDLFDFNGDGDVSISDVQALFAEL